MVRKVAIFGALGQLGVELTKVFQNLRCSVSTSDKDTCDITDAASVESYITRLDPEIVVNAAAYNQVDVAEQEPQAAFLVNALAVRNLAVTCRQTDALFVHYSTDYVFDGMAGKPYVETDPTHPLGAYGVSKLAGEFYAQAYLDEVLIIRTSGVFGPGGLHTARGNFVELMLRLAAKRQPIKVVEDHVASPAFAPALADRTVQLIERKQRGLFHIGGGVPISWYEYAKLIFAAAGLKPELRPTNEREYRTSARRPKYSALSNAKMESVGVMPMPPMEEALKAYMAARGL